MKKRRVTALLTAAAIVLTGATACGKSSVATSEATVNYSTADASEMSASEEYEENRYWEEDDTYYEYPEEEAVAYAAGTYDATADGYAPAAVNGEAYDTEAFSGATLQAKTANTGYREDSEVSCDEDGTYYDEIYDREDGKTKDYRKNYLGEIYDYDCFPKDFNSEEYLKLEEQGYKSVLNAPLSTFAADVDTASYSNLRRMLNEGYSLYDLPKGSIRVEELVNYFNYDYEGPRRNEPFGVNAQMMDCPWNSDAKLLSIGLKTEDIDFSETPASNLVFLIDVSGSMSDYDKLPLLQEAFCMLVDELSDKDRVSIVTYANGVNTVLKGEKGSNGRAIKCAINDLFASGGTNGGKGIQTAYDLAEDYFIKGGNNRIILATDGDLNIGVTSVEDLEKLISKKKESGVYLSVLGFGTGNIKDNRMETLADKGNGNYAYIDSVREAKKVLVDELSSNLLTVCKDVKFQAEFNPAYVKGYRLVGYADRVMKNRDFNDDKKDGGEIGAGHEVTALYEVILTDDYRVDDDDVDMGGLKYKDEHKKAEGKGSNSKSRQRYDRNAEFMTLSIRYKKPSEDKSSLLTYPITMEAYTTNPTNDLVFQSAVAEIGLIASNSEYMGSADVFEVLGRLDDIRLNDEYKREFMEMIEMARY